MDQIDKGESLRRTAVPPNQAKKLAQLIARTIFSLGDNCYPPHTANRIQFMAGEYPNERGLCGLNERALTDVIMDAIRSAGLQS